MADGKKAMQGLMNDAVDGLQGVFESTQGGMQGLPLAQVSTAMWGANKNINVTLDWPWLEPHIMTRNERKVIPSIYMREYEISENGLYSTINYYKLQKEENAKGSDANPYKGLYAGAKTGMFFTFPYISSWAGGLTTEWDKAEDMAERSGMPTDKMGMFGEAAGQAAEMAGSAAKFTGMLSTMMTKMKNKNEVMILNPVIPKVWKGTQGEEINVVFYLFNTDSQPSQWINNWKLITYLKMAVTFNQLNAMFATPPAIYTVTIPSIVHMSSAYISSYKVEQVGNCIYYDTTQGGGGNNGGSGGVGAESMGWSVGAEDMSSNPYSGYSSEQLVSMMKKQAKYGIFGESRQIYEELKKRKNEEQQAKDITNTGPKNLLVVPDAWKLSIKITELIDMSRQMVYHGLLKNGNYENVASITGAAGENPEQITPPQLPSDITYNDGPTVESGANSSANSEESRDSFDGSRKPTVNAETL